MEPSSSVRYASAIAHRCKTSTAVACILCLLVQTCSFGQTTAPAPGTGPTTGPAATPAPASTSASAPQTTAAEAAAAAKAARERAAAEAKAAQERAEAAARAALYAHREKGLRAMGDHICAAAARFFLEYRKAAKGQEPALTDATILLVRAYLEQNTLTEADQALEYHKKNSPGVADPYFRDGLTYWSAAVLLSHGKWAEATAKATPLMQKTAVAEFRNRALELVGDAAVLQEKWPQAQTAFEQLLSEFPEADNALRARLGLSRVFLATQQTRRAAEMLERVKERHENAPLLLLSVYRVLLLLQEDKLSEAYGLYRSIGGDRPQTPDPDWWTAASHLSEELLLAKRYEEALEILPQAEALAANPLERMQIHLRTSECLIALEKVELAINSLETFKKTYPDSPDVVPVQVKLAELLRRTKNFMTASEYFGEVAQNGKASPAFRYRSAISRGWCLRDAGQLNQAVDAFSGAEALGQTDDEKAKALFLAGDTAFLIDAFTDASTLYGRAADQYPKSASAEAARFHQARSFANAKLYSSAAETYGRLSKDFPSTQFIEDATLEWGVALRNAGMNDQALKRLSSFATSYPASSHAPRALMEAYQAAMAIGPDHISEALELLSRVIDSYPDAELFPHAIHQRAFVNFSQGSYDDAVRDCTLFLDKFALLPMATDVLIWLGDHFANVGESEESEKYFLKLVTSHPRSPHAPGALYEAAKSAYERNDMTGAALLLQQLRVTYVDRETAQDHPEASAKVQAQLELLHGDILAKSGSFADALTHFTHARELAGDTPLGISALGRRGDMYYSLGAANPKDLDEAIACFLAISGNKAAPADLKELAKYRLGKCYDRQGLTEAAITAYIDVHYQYQMDAERGVVRNSLYFVRSSYDAARLLVLDEQFRQATRIYEVVGKMGLPMSDDARQRAKEIRDAHKLNE